jgi:allene oxide cyclase
MRRLAVAVGAVAVLAVGGVAFAASSGAQAPGPQTLVLKEKDGKFAFVDEQPRSKRGRASLGDQLIVSNLLFDSANKRVGSLQAVCTTVKAGRDNATYLCQGVAHLNDGDLLLEARLQDQVTISGAITGGTGAYANARGTFTSQGEEAPTDTFVFTTS